MAHHSQLDSIYTGQQHSPGIPAYTVDCTHTPSDDHLSEFWLACLLALPLWFACQVCQPTRYRLYWPCKDLFYLLSLLFGTRSVWSSVTDKRVWLKMSIIMSKRFSPTEIKLHVFRLHHTGVLYNITCPVLFLFCFGFMVVHGAYSSQNDIVFSFVERHPLCIQPDKSFHFKLQLYES